MLVDVNEMRLNQITVSFYYAIPKLIKAQVPRIVANSFIPISSNTRLKASPNCLVPADLALIIFEQSRETLSRQRKIRTEVF